jgi:hypothetical protein
MSINVFIYNQLIPVWSTPMQQWLRLVLVEQFQQMDQCLKVDASSFNLMCWLTQILSCSGNAYGVHPDFLFCGKNCKPLTWTMTVESTLWRVFFSTPLLPTKGGCFQTQKTICNEYAKQRQVSQVVLVFETFTSWTASTGVSNLDAVKGWAKTNLLWY